MQKVKTRKPVAHDLITSFGKHYDRKTGTLDLSNVPMLFRIYGPKIKKRQSDQLTNVVKDGGKVVNKAILMARLISGQRIRVKKRYLIKEFSRSFHRLLEDQAKFASNESAGEDLLRNSPLWIIELVAIVDGVQNTLSGLARPGFRATR